MSSVFSAVQLAAINRYCKENNAVPQLSTPPYTNIRFKIKGTDIYKEESLFELVHNDKMSKIEEAKDRADEKKKKEREEKYMPKGY
jgi:hypothetical protein